MEIGGKKIVIGPRALVLVGLSVLVLIGVFVSLKKGSFLEKSPNSSKAPEIADMNLDIDNDGIPDRIEKVIATSIEKIDTDGDGYMDLEEVENSYSPIIASPGGKLLPEEFSALKEEIKNIDQEFYEKTFAKKNDLAVSSLLSASLDPEPSASLTPVILSGPAIFKGEVSLSNKNWKYSFYAPADLDTGKEYSLMIGLHGFEGKAVDFIKYWQSDADKNKFLVAILQAYPKTYPNGATIESYPWLEIGDFTKAVLANIEKKYKIDENRIFLTGYSAGASTSYILALDSGIKFKGVIPIDGYLPLEAGIIDKLNKAKDVNFYVVHGADDADQKAVVSQEKILLQYDAKMEFKILPGVAHEYPASEHENILKWIEGLK